MREPIFGLGLTARSPNVSAQHRINLLLEIRQQGEDKSRVIAYGTPGLSAPLIDLGQTGIRGLHALGTYYYVVHRGTLWQVTNAGTTTNRGTLLTTSGRVYFADNGTTLMLVDGTYGYTFNTGTNAFARILDVDYVAANTVTWQDRYYIQDAAATGRFYISVIDDPTNWNSLDFATADKSPDNLVRVHADHGELVLFGEVTTEFWGDSGATDFPYARLGSSAIEWGLAARDSLAKFQSSLMFLAANRMGQVQVVLLNGYTPQPVGTPDFLAQINGYTTVSDATAFSYMLNGHPLYQINFPTPSKSWLYDGASGQWSELQSGGARHYADLGVLYLGKTIVGDYQLGRVYRLDLDTFTDNGTPIAREIRSRHIFGDPWAKVSQLWLDIEGGVGLNSGQGSDPQVMLTVSKDNGHSWGNWRSRSLGPIGAFRTRAVWNTAGPRSRDLVFRVRITDPVKVAIMNEGFIE